jgi:signal peptide peptidase SppA
MNKSLLNGLAGREPLLIDPIKAANHVKYAEKYGVIDGVLDMFFNPVQKPYVTANGTGVIQLRGVLGIGLTKFEKATGGADMVDVGNTIDEMIANPAVKRVAFDVSSPGGTVLGTPELASKVAGMTKPTMAYTKDLMASGAYYVSSQADNVVASPSAYVGSIGVIMVDESYIEYYKQIGLQVEVFRAGWAKAANISGTGYTDEQRALEQASIDAMHQKFKAVVLSKRSMASEADMQGQVFTGEQAAAKNLITGLADSFEQALASFEGSAVIPAARSATVGFKSGKSAKAMAKQMSVEIEPEVVDLLSPRQRDLVDCYSDIEKTFGQFNQGIDADGAHYSAESPFASEGLLCQNCVFYRGPRGCQLVAGDIDPNGICKLWVIPSNPNA